MKIAFFLISFHLAFSFAAMSQTNLTFEDLYQKNIPLYQDIISGGYYLDPPKEIEGHPYFMSRNLEMSTVTINGLRYQKVPLSYNIFTDELVTFQPIYKQKILIRPDKINAFEMDIKGKRTFVIVPENPGYLHHRKGIYEILDAGEVNLLRKHYKLTKPKRELSVYTSIFSEKSDYFLQKTREIKRINKHKQAFEFLGLDRKAIKKQLREKQLTFRENPAAYLTFLTQLYNKQELLR